MNDLRSASQTPGIKRHWAYLIIFAIILLLFYPIFESYAYTDVYEFLYHAHNDNFIHVFIQGGRPLYGLLNKFLLTSISTVDQLQWLRLFGVAGLGLTVFLFFHVLNRFLLSKSSALLCSLLFLLTPSASITGLWVGTYQLGWGLAMALWGGYSMVIALTNAESKKMWLMILSGVALGLLSLLTYQPAYTAFIIPGLIYLLKKVDLKKTIYFLGVYFSLYAVYYVIHNLILKLTHLQPLARTGLTDDPIGKLFWFFRWPIKMVYEDNFIFYNAAWQKLTVAVFFLLTLIAVFYLILNNKNRITISIAIIGIIAFLFSSYVPNLLSSDNWVSYRTLSTLFMFKWVLVFFALNELQMRYRFTLLIVSVFSFLFIANAWYNINEGFVSIQADEFKVIKNEVDRLIPQMEEKDQLVFIMPDFEFLVKQDRVSRVVSDEFGSLSTSRNWVPMPIVKQVLREKNETELEKSLKVIMIMSSERTKLSEYPGAPVLDVEELMLHTGN